MVSKDASAYTYLPESVNAFPEGSEFRTIMVNIGYRDIKTIPCLFGVASIYKAVK